MSDSKDGLLQLLFKKSLYDWILDAKYLVYNCLLKFWPENLNLWLSNHCQRINESDQLVEKDKLKAWNMKEYKRAKKCLNNLKNIVLNKLHYLRNVKKSFNNDQYKKNNRNQAQNYFTKSISEIDNFTKDFFKKWMENDIDVRFELLYTHKKLHAKIKEVKQLEKQLLDAKETIQNIVNDNKHFQPTSLTNSRSCFFDSSLLTMKDRVKKSLITKRAQQSTLEEKISQLEDIYQTEVFNLQDEIYKKEEIIKKLNEKYEEVLTIYQKLKLENEILKFEKKMKDLSPIKRNDEQETPKEVHAYESHSHSHSQVPINHKLNVTVLQEKERLDREHNLEIKKYLQYQLDRIMDNLQNTGLKDYPQNHDQSNEIKSTSASTTLALASQ